MITGKHTACAFAVAVATLLLATGGCPPSSQLDPNLVGDVIDAIGGLDDAGDGPASSDQPASGNDADAGESGNGQAPADDGAGGTADGGGGAPATDPMSPFYGTYDVTFTGQVGGPYEPTNSIVSGTTTGVVPFTLTGSITLDASQPGVISVADGETVPGVAPGDVIFGAAVVQNPISVFMGTDPSDFAGDFLLHSRMTFGIPGDPPQLFYTGGGSGPFDLVPMFYRRTQPSGENVTLIYTVHQVSGDAGQLRIQGTLMDIHAAEAAAGNTFLVPIESPILGTMNDIFCFERGATFDLTVSGGQISGSVAGTGRSAATLVPQTAQFQATFGGSRSNH